MTDFRMNWPKKGELTQGYMFTCAVAEGYSDVSVWGIVITARCDIAHGKTHTISYVPIVRVMDWLQQDGMDILASRLIKSKKEQLAQKLKAYNHAPSIVQHVTPREIYETLFFREEVKSADKNKVKGVVEDIEELLELCKRLPAQSDTQTLYNRIASSRLAKDVENFVKDCAKCKINGYYFFPKVSPDGSESGYVALLRQVHSMPAKLAKLLISGMEYNEYMSICDSDTTAVNRLRFTVAGEQAMPIGVVRSPFVEHFMQAFATLYSRIGIEDTPSEYIEKLWETLGPHSSGVNEDD